MDSILTSVSKMEDNVNELQIQSSTSPEKDVYIDGGATEDEISHLQPGMTEGDDSVFYSEEEEIPQRILDSIWAPDSGEPIWPEKPNSAQIQNSGACSSDCSPVQTGDCPQHVARLAEMESKMENKVNNASSTDTDVQTAGNSRITHSEELLTPPAGPLRGTEALQMKERANTYPDEGGSFLPDEAKETGLPGVGCVSLEDVEQEFTLDLACESDGKPFNHLKQAKYGTVSYRKIQRGQTRKRIEMFESMMQL